MAEAKKRRVTIVDPEPATFYAINLGTGEVLECASLVTLVQQVARDFAVTGDARTWELHRDEPYSTGT